MLSLLPLVDSVGKLSEHVLGQGARLLRYHVHQTLVALLLVAMVTGLKLQLSVELFDGFHGNWITTPIVFLQWQ